MKFVATLVLVLAVASGVRAIHPPMENPPSSTSHPGSPGTTTVVHTTGNGTTTSVVPTPEPGTVTLALLGLLGGTTYRLVRRKRGGAPAAK